MAPHRLDIFRPNHRNPDQDAIVFTPSPWRMTWRKFDSEVERVAQALLAAGFQRRDHFGAWGDKGVSVRNVPGCGHPVRRSMAPKRIGQLPSDAFPTSPIVLHVDK